MKARLLRLLWLAPTVISIAYFAFWACAPAAYLDPPLAASGPRGQIGGGAVYSTSLPKRQASGERPDGLDGQLWFQRRFDRLGFSVQLAAGQSALLSAGGSLRVYLLDRPRFRMATDVQAGLVYAGAALPMVALLTPDLEWYIAPWASLRAGKILRLPTGLRYRTPLGASFSLEAGAAALQDNGEADEVEVWGALGVSFPLLQNQ